MGNCKSKSQNQFIAPSYHDNPKGVFRYDKDSKQIVYVGEDAEATEITAIASKSSDLTTTTNEGELCISSDSTSFSAEHNALDDTPRERSLLVEITEFLEEDGDDSTAYSISTRGGASPMMFSPEKYTGPSQGDEFLSPYYHNITGDSNVDIQRAAVSPLAFEHETLGKYKVTNDQYTIQRKSSEDDTDKSDSTEKSRKSEDSSTLNGLMHTLSGESSEYRNNDLAEASSNDSEDCDDFYIPGVNTQKGAVTFQAIENDTSNEYYSNMVLLDDESHSSLDDIQSALEKVQDERVEHNEDQDDYNKGYTPLTLPGSSDSQEEYESDEEVTTINKDPSIEDLTNTSKSDDTMPEGAIQAASAEDQEEYDDDCVLLALCGSADSQEEYESDEEVTTINKDASIEDLTNTSKSDDTMPEGAIQAASNEDQEEYDDSCVLLALCGSADSKEEYNSDEEVTTINKDASIEDLTNTSKSDDTMSEGAIQAASNEDQEEYDDGCVLLALCGSADSKEEYDSDEEVTTINKDASIEDLTNTSKSDDTMPEGAIQAASNEDQEEYDDGCVLLALCGSADSEEEYDSDEEVTTINKDASIEDLTNTSKSDDTMPEGAIQAASNEDQEEYDDGCVLLALCGSADSKEEYDSDEEVTTINKDASIEDLTNTSKSDDTMLEEKADVVNLTNSKSNFEVIETLQAFTARTIECNASIERKEVIPDEVGYSEVQVEIDHVKDDAAFAPVPSLCQEVVENSVSHVKRSVDTIISADNKPQKSHEDERENDNDDDLGILPSSNKAFTIQTASISMEPIAHKECALDHISGDQHIHEQNSDIDLAEHIERTKSAYSKIDCNGLGDKGHHSPITIATNALEIEGRVRSMQQTNDSTNIKNASLKVEYPSTIARVKGTECFDEDHNYLVSQNEKMGTDNVESQNSSSKKNSPFDFLNGELNKMLKKDKESTTVGKKPVAPIDKQLISTPKNNGSDVESGTNDISYGDFSEGTTNKEATFISDNDDGLSFGDDGLSFDDEDADADLSIAGSIIKDFTETKENNKASANVSNVKLYMVDRMLPSIDINKEDLLLADEIPLNENGNIAGCGSSSTLMTPEICSQQDVVSTHACTKDDFGNHLLVNDTSVPLDQDIKKCEDSDESPVMSPEVPQKDKVEIQFCLSSTSKNFDKETQSIVDEMSSLLDDNISNSEDSGDKSLLHSPETKSSKRDGIGFDKRSADAESNDRSLAGKAKENNVTTLTMSESRNTNILFLSESPGTRTSHIPRVPHNSPMKYHSPYQGNRKSAIQQLSPVRLYSRTPSRQLDLIVNPPIVKTPTEQNIKVIGRTSSVSSTISSSEESITPKSLPWDEKGSRKSEKKDFQRLLKTAKRPKRSPAKGVVCANKWEPYSHAVKGGCERCLTLCCRTEVEDFFKFGRHQRVTRTSGGCTNHCARYAGERFYDSERVRLCRICYHAVHRKSKGSIKDSTVRSLTSEYS
jgi:hypothetical protein